MPSPEEIGPGIPRDDSGSRKTDRELVEAALRAAKPRTATPAFDDHRLPPTDAFPGYEIVREVHRGGQGVVYQAIQRATKRKVALKVLHGGPFTGSKGRARFDREVAILAQLQHPNIVSIVDSGTAAGQSFYVMDYVSGQTLDTWMAGEPKPIGDVLALFSKICDAVNAAHLKGITHRDLKPSNIRIDHSGEPHVLDFGLAKVVVGEVTDETQMQVMSMTGQFIGSLPWASPEQAEGIPGKVDLRTDVYSLGVILYQLLTGGKFPYEVVGNMRDVMDNILRAEPAKPSTIRRQINDEVETIILKSLQKERDRRYQSAGELARDIKRYLSGEPIEAMRDSGWYVVRKTIRKYKAPTAVVAGFLALIIGFGVISFWLYRRADRAWRETDTALSEKNVALGVAESQKKRAEELNQAFARVSAAGREFRRSTFTEYFKKIENLLGATPAKELLLRDGLAYLDALRKDASADPTFREELADALEAVGKIQTGLYTPHVGGSADALGTLQEAVGLREKLVAEQPSNPERLIGMSRVLLDLAQVERLGQKFDDALREAKRALEHAERAVTGGATVAPEVLEEMKASRANAHVITGELLIRIARDKPALAEMEALITEGESHYDLAATYWRERLKADPKNAKAARLDVALDDKKSQPMMFRAAMLVREAKQAASAKDLAKARERFDGARSLYESALALSERSLGRFVALAEMYKGDAEIGRSVYVSRANMADALTRLGTLESDAAAALDEPNRLAGALTRFEDAGKVVQTAMGEVRTAASADPKNLDAQRSVYVMLNKLAAQQSGLGRRLRSQGVKERDAALEQRGRGLIEAALLTLDESRVQNEMVAERDGTYLHALDLAGVYSTLGDVSKDLDRFSDALGWYEKSRGMLEELASKGAYDRSLKDYQDVMKGIEDMKAKAGK